MADEQVLKLLEEIRDLQKLHVENYKDALKNQRESIDIQNRVARRQKVSLVVVGFLLVALWVFVAFVSHH